MKIVKNITAIDAPCVKAIQRNGGVIRIERGDGFLEFDGFRKGIIGRGRLDRLEKHGLISPSLDALFKDSPSQTYSLTDKVLQITLSE